MTDHHDRAEAILEAVPDSATASPQHAIMLAYVHATLALVEVLRKSSTAERTPTLRQVDSPPPSATGGMVRVCPQCSGPVSSPFPGAVYCSKGCRERAKYLRQVASGYEASKRAARTARYRSDAEFRAAMLGRKRAERERRAVRTVDAPSGAS